MKRFWRWLTWKRKTLKQLSEDVASLEAAIFPTSFLGWFPFERQGKETQITQIRARVRVLERKIDLLMKHFKLEFLEQGEHPDYEVIKERPKPKDGDD